MSYGKTLFLFGLVLLMVSGCWGETQPQRAPDLVLTPQAGGMTLPTAIPAQPAASEGLEAEPPAVLAVGQSVVATGERSLRLQASASSDSAVLDVYPPGAIFIVIEPSGAYTGYPVQVEGRAWYRLQAADGLVGWAIIDEIMARPVDQ